VTLILVSGARYYLVEGKVDEKFLDLVIIGQIGALTVGLYFGLGYFHLSR
jgi:hypothetical protein